MPGTTHVAGPVVVINGRIIQRCVVCGEKLCDNFRAEMALGPNGETPDFPVWQERALVEICDSRHLLVGDFCDDDKPLPKNFCLALVEE